MGFFKKVGSKTADSAKKITNYDEISTNWQLIKRGVTALNPNNIKEGRVETFQNACQRLGLSESDMARVYFNWFVTFFISAVFLVAGLVVSISQAADGEWVSLMSMVGFGALCLSLMFRSSFKMYQMRIRTFCDVNQWVGNPLEWVPFGWELPKASVSAPAARRQAPPAKKQEKK